MCKATSSFLGLLSSYRKSIYILLSLAVQNLLNKELSWVKVKFVKGYRKQIAVLL